LIEWLNALLLPVYMLSVVVASNEPRFRTSLARASPLVIHDEGPGSPRLVLGAPGIRLGAPPG